ncbi:MAG: D-aminoacyl-tRNA deacylase [Actinomycetota bacterium]|nr:D-aminoacyl-tRNA deacylase [Actinomycetota bacterium]
MVRVRVREEAVGEIGAGPCVLLGVAHGDGPTEASRLAGKVARLRIFEDEQGRFDRFGRDQIEGCLALRRLTLCGARLLGVEDGFDSRSPGSKMLFQMRMMVAEDYLNRVRDGWATARKRATERGVLSARTPYGYSRGEDGRLLPNEQAGVVQMIFRLKAEGKQPLYEAFYDELRQLGVAVKTGVFDARMQVELTNEGPVTIVL